MTRLDPVFSQRPPQPLGSYEGAIIRAGMGFVSGQFPLRAGELTHTGRIGGALTIEDGRYACSVAAYNVLSHIHDATQGYERLEGLLRVEGFIASASNFTNHAIILDAASDIFRDTLGEKGRHARMLVPVSRLPLNAPIELCVSFCAHWNN